MHRVRHVVAAAATLSIFAASGVFALTAVASAASAAGGEAAKPAAAIISDAKAATGGAKSVRVVGSSTSGGSSLKLNVVAGQGEGGGTVDIGPIVEFHIVVRSKKVYVKGNKATWTQVAKDNNDKKGEAAAPLLADKWIRLPLANGGNDYAQFVEISKLINQMVSSDKVVKKGTTTFKGQPAIRLVDAKNGATAYVAAEGPPFFLGIVGTKQRQVMATFSQYNMAPIPAAPKKSITLNGA